MKDTVDVNASYLGHKEDLEADVRQAVRQIGRIVKRYKAAVKAGQPSVSAILLKHTETAYKELDRAIRNYESAPGPAEPGPSKRS